MDIIPNQHQGFLFKNKNKKSENHPDYKGFIKVKGEDDTVLDIAAWMNKSKSGTMYMSISFSEPWKKENVSNETIEVKEEPKSIKDIIDDDIPF